MVEYEHLKPTLEKKYRYEPPKDLKKSKWHSFLYGVCTFGIFSSPFMFKFKRKD